MTLPPAILNELVASSTSGQWQKMATIARGLTVRYPAHAIGWKALGKASLMLGLTAEALDSLRRAVRIAPGDADSHNDLGRAFHNAGLLGEAEASYRKAQALNPNLPQTCANLGNLLAETGRRLDAVDCHRAALALAPANPVTHNNMGSVYYDLGRNGDAETAYRDAIALNPQYLEAWVNLGTVLRADAKWSDAEKCYRRALEIDPDSTAAMFALCSMLGKLCRNDAEVVALLEQVIRREPDHVDAYVELGNVQLRLGNTAASWEAFRRAQELRPLMTWPAAAAKPDFSAVFLDTPGAGSTPLDYLAGRASYDRHFYCVVPDAEPGFFESLKAKADVVFNMIADADNGTKILPFVTRIADRLDCPIVNHPRLILENDRETVARRLAGIPLCRIPKTVRCNGHELEKSAPEERLPEMGLPVLVRVAGTHGGDALDKCDDWPAVKAFMAGRVDASYYVSEYIDYRSPDGYFRKYRWICMDGEIYPYHLAIHRDWKVHYFRTDMTDHDWMRHEEEEFLRTPQAVFDSSCMNALAAIAEATRLDYCGIDCGLDRNNNIVVFEANATMLVHDEKEDVFAYKNPYIAKIKQAFDAMLARRVSAAK
jgi:Flp pilus assembly protein TadD